MSEGKELALIDRARTALAEARTLGEVIEIRDQAAALQHYAAKKQGAQEAERYANELRIRAERKIGEITRTMRKHPAGRASAGFTPTDGDDRPKLERLAEHGLTTQDASRFERLASVPEAEFERSVTAREATRTKIASAVPPRQRRGRVARATRKVRFKEPGTDPRGVRRHGHVGRCRYARRLLQCRLCPRAEVARLSGRALAPCAPFPLDTSARSWTLESVTKPRKTTSPSDSPRPGPPCAGFVTVTYRIGRAGESGGFAWIALGAAG